MAKKTVLQRRMRTCRNASETEAERSRCEQKAARSAYAPLVRERLMHGIVKMKAEAGPTHAGAARQAITFKVLPLPSSPCALSLTFSAPLSRASSLVGEGAGCALLGCGCG